jgi:hypothetical protein
LLKKFKLILQEVLQILFVQFFETLAPHLESPDLGFIDTFLFQFEIAPSVCSHCVVYVLLDFSLEPMLRKLFSNVVDVALTPDYYV